MAEETRNNNEYPFQIKLYQNRLPEVIVDEVIHSSLHKICPALVALLKKYPLVFLELGEKAKICEKAGSFFQELENPERLIIIPKEPQQIDANVSPVIVLPTVQSALLRIKNKAGIEKAAEMLGKMPIFKSPVFDYLELLKDDTITFDFLERELKKSEEISESILEICNTMAKARGNPFANLNKALHFVGLEGVRQMLIERAFVILTKLFRGQREKLCHLRRVSTLAGRLGSIFDNNIHIFWRMRSAGLMHDIGSLLIAHYSAKDAARCYNFAREKKLNLLDVENLVLGYNHCEAGLLMANLLHLPDYLIPSVTDHHNKYVNPKDTLLAATMIANGYLNANSELIGATDYENSIEYLDDAREAYKTERREKEYAKKLSRIDPEDLEALKELEEEYHPKPNPEEELSEFKSASQKRAFDIVDVEFIFKENLAKTLKDGYELKEF